MRRCDRIRNAAGGKRVIITFRVGVSSGGFQRNRNSWAKGVAAARAVDCEI